MSELVTWEQLATLLRRYLDSHCHAADREGMSALCECSLCLDTRAALALEAKGLTREDAKTIYAEGIETGIQIGRGLKPVPTR